MQNLLMANSDKIREAKGARDKNLTKIESVNLFFSVLLAVFSFIHLICGVKFLKNDVVSSGSDGMGRLQRFSSIFIAFTCIGTVMFAVAAYCITKRRNTSRFCLLVYGVLLLGIGLPPLFTVGVSMYELSRMETTEILQYCKMEPERVEQQTGKFLSYVL